ncbi:hypothetical protein TYRP_018226 [Tyrophagus putrescentiae]|nr:hypothetical protein TYRP_018226 [Tyrophagus putrescentiae]
MTLTSSHWAPARSTFADALPNEAPDEVAAVVAPGIADEGVRPKGVRLLIRLNVVQSGGGAAAGDGTSHCAAGTNVDALVVVVVRGRQFVVAAQLLGLWLGQLSKGIAGTFYGRFFCCLWWNHSSPVERHVGRLLVAALPGEVGNVVRRVELHVEGDQSVGHQVVQCAEALQLVDVVGGSVVEEAVVLGQGVEAQREGHLTAGARRLAHQVPPVLAVLLQQQLVGLLAGHYPCAGRLEMLKRQMTLFGVGAFCCSSYTEGKRWVPPQQRDTAAEVLELLQCSLCRRISHQRCSPLESMSSSCGSGSWSNGIRDCVSKCLSCAVEQCDSVADN